MFTSYPKEKSETKDEHRPGRRLGNAGRQLHRAAERLPRRREVDGELSLIRGERASRRRDRSEGAVEQRDGERVRGEQPAIGEGAFGRRAGIVGKTVDGEGRERVPGPEDG